MLSIRGRLKILSSVDKLGLIFLSTQHRCRLRNVNVLIYTRMTNETTCIGLCCFGHALMCTEQSDRNVSFLCDIRQCCVYACLHIIISYTLIRIIEGIRDDKICQYTDLGGKVANKSSSTGGFNVEGYVFFMTF